MAQHQLYRDNDDPRNIQFAKTMKNVQKNGMEDLSSQMGKQIAKRLQQ